MIVALAGGVGGARLARGLAAIKAAELAIVVNTGDDFVHLGLTICPDLDTVTYTLAGIANPDTGWGIAGETWNFMAQNAVLGEPEWFRLGDRDLATHVLRSRLLGEGKTLTEVSTHLARRFGIAAAILPMTDAQVRTRVETAEGLLDFQDYFVRRQCKVPITGFRFDGAQAAPATPEVAAALDRATAIVFCPSNPYVSIDPILAVRDIRSRLERHTAPRIAVSPIIGGRAVKGPAARMMAELGHAASSLTVAKKYLGLIDAMVIDREDAPLAPDIEALGLRVLTTQTLMRTPEDSRVLADETLRFAQALNARQA